MIRIVLRGLLALATTVAGLTLWAAPVGAGDARGPACSDFSGKADMFYSATDTTGEAVVQISFDLAGPSCSDWTYNLHVLDATGARELVSTSTAGDGTQRLTMRASVPGDPLLPPDNVCIYTTTTTKGGRVSDRAPDTGCQQVKLGGPPPGQNWS